MRVVIPESELERLKSCGDHLTSPWWDEGERSLVYPDWDEAAAKMSLSRDGARRLKWLVLHKMVPTTLTRYMELRQQAAKATEKTDG